MLPTVHPKTDLEITGQLHNLWVKLHIFIYTYIDTRSFALNKISLFVLIHIQVNIFTTLHAVYYSSHRLPHLLIVTGRQNDCIFYIQHNGAASKPDEPRSTGIHFMLTSEEHDVIVQKHHPNVFYQTHLQ